jgi:hypothetical protein
MLAYLENVDPYCLPGHSETVSVWAIASGETKSWAVPAEAGDAIRLEWRTEVEIAVMFSDNSESTLSVTGDGLGPVP